MLKITFLATRRIQPGIPFDEVSQAGLAEPITLPFDLTSVNPLDNGQIRLEIDGTIYLTEGPVTITK
jgi:hypothetical protein